MEIIKDTGWVKVNHLVSTRTITKKNLKTQKISVQRFIIRVKAV